MAISFNRYKFGAACVLFVVPCTAGAAEWEIRAAVTPNVTYTDNVCLDDDNKKSEWIASATPSASVNGRGSRSTVNFDGSLQFTTLDNNDTECENRGGSGNRGESPIPSGSFGTTNELVRDWFYFDARASARQNTVNQFRAGGQDGLNRSGNVNTSTAYEVNPYIERRLKSVADFRLSYSYDEQFNSEDVVGDSEAERIDVSLTSARDIGRFGWGLSAYRDEVNFDEQRDDGQVDNTLKSVQLDASVRLTRSFSLSGYYGIEDNDFFTVQDDTDDTFWSAGMSWTPTPRTTLSLGMGERFFGNTPYLSFSHRSKKSAIVVSYSETITFSRDLRTAANGTSRSVQVGEDGDLGVVEGVDGFGQPTSLSRNPIQNEQFSATYRLSGRRSNVSLTATRSIQTRLDIDDTSEFTSASLSATRRLGRGFAVDAGVFWDDSEAGIDAGQVAGDSETWRCDIGFTGDLGPNASLSFSYVYTDRDSELERDTYKENRATISLRIDL